MSHIKENYKQNICNKCHIAIFSKSFVTCLKCEKSIKNVYIEILYEQILLTAKQDTRHAKIEEN